MRPIMISPCSVCGVTLEHDQDPRTVLCGGCERDKPMARRHLVPPPTTECHGKPAPPEPPPMRQPNRDKIQTTKAFGSICFMALSIAIGFLWGWIARGGA